MTSMPQSVLTHSKIDKQTNKQTNSLVNVLLLMYEVTFPEALGAMMMGSMTNPNMRRNMMKLSSTRKRRKEK